MPQLEPLNLKLTGSADGLSTALGKAERDTKGFSWSIGGISDRFKSIAAAAAPAAAVATAALASIAAAAAPVVIALGKIREQFDVVDELADAANRLGVSVTELKGLRLSIGEATGLEGDQIDNAIAKLQINLGEAAEEGAGKVHDALESIGLDAAELLAAGPMRAVEMIATAVSQVDDKARQLKLAFDIFGKSGVAVAAALRQSPEALRETFEWSRRNLSLTEAQVEAIGRANDAWGRVGEVVATFFQILAADAAPFVESLGNELLAIVDSLGGAKQVTEDIVTEGARWLGWLADVYELIELIRATMGNIAKMDFTAPLEQIEKAFTFDQGEKFVAALERSRAELAAREARPKGPTEAELAALEATEAAALATEEAAKAVEEKAKNVAAQQIAAPPTVLAAVTDRAAQIRRVAELEARREAMEQSRRLLAAAELHNVKLDRLISVVAAGEPIPINLD